MPIGAHLREFRSRLLKSVLAIAVGAVVAFFLWPRVLELLTVPLCAARDELHTQIDGCELVFFGPFDALVQRLKMSMALGTALAAPFWLWQFWQFVTPGLHRHERRWALTFTAAATALFATGTVVAYFTLEAGLRILLAAGGDAAVPLLELNRYLSYVTTMIVVFGVSFLLPLFVVMLNMAGVLTYAAAARWRRLTWFVLFVFAAFATPSQDPISMLALAVPMVLLYEAALVVARVRDRRRARRDAALDGGVAPGLDDETASIIEPPSGVVTSTSEEPTREGWNR